MPQSKKYFTEEERKAAHRAVVMRYQARNREKVQACQAAYREAESYFKQDSDGDNRR